MNARGTRRPTGRGGSRPRTGGAGRGGSSSGCAVVLVFVGAVLAVSAYAALAVMWL